MSIEYLNRSLERLHDNTDGDSINLDGMEQLWRIILEANNEMLASDASTYLVNFYLDVGLPEYPLSSTPALTNPCSHVL